MRATIISVLSIALPWVAAAGSAQAPASAPDAQKQLTHVLGTVVDANSAGQTVSVKDDKTGTVYNVDLSATRTLLKVSPGATDLKSASRITSADLQAGDRVDVRGSGDGDNATAIKARSLVLMSGRELAAKHEAERGEWANSTAGTVAAVDSTSGTVTMNVRHGAQTQPEIVKTSSAVDFLRYSPENPGTPSKSNLSAIQPGDQIRVIGDASADGTPSIAARKIYSGAFRTVAGTVTSIDSAGRTLTITDAQTKKPQKLSLSSSLVVKKIPPEMAARIAQRMSGQGQSAGGGTARPPSDASAEAGADQRPSGGGPGMRGGDISRLLDRLPTTTLDDLKPGDSVVVAAALSDDKTHLIANTVIAGVESLLAAAPGRSGAASRMGEWSLDMSVPAQ
jgi:hypothetical protein